MTLSVEADQLDLTRFLKRGDHIVSGHAGGEPTTLIEAVVAQGGGLDLSLFAATSFSGLYDARAGEAVKVSSIGAIGQLRALTAVNRLTVIPLHIAQIGPLIDQGLLPCDVAFIQVSPADAEGNHSLGLISDHVLNAVAKARLVIAEVNDQVPYTLGATIPASKVDVAVLLPASVAVTWICVLAFGFNTFTVSCDPLTVAVATLGSSLVAVYVRGDTT